jgi:hypothetical protein
LLFKLGSNNSFQPQSTILTRIRFCGNTVGNRLNDDADPAQNDAFFSPLEFKETKKTVDSNGDTTAPGMRLN